MAYCTVDDLLKALPESILIALTDDDGTGAIDETRTEEAIAAAGAEIDGYCEGRYDTPFSPVPALIKKCAVDIAIYNLYARRNEEIPETRAERYRNAGKLLAKIASRDIALDAATPGAAETGGPEVSTAGDRIFTRTTLEGY